MLHHAQHMNQELQMPYRAFCTEMAVPLSNLRRWRKRQADGRPLVQKSGPKKLEPLPLEALQREIAGLDHGARRTQGTGALYARWESAISRRDLDAFIRQARREAKRRRRQALKRIEWLCPGLVWAMDAVEWGRDALGRKLFAHGAVDLASRYHLPSWVALQSRGVEIAAWLEKLFRRYGAPLLFKRDNGSPFNCPEVDALFSEWGVIPLNNPPYYAPYNGAKERSGRELRAGAGPDFAPDPLWELKADCQTIALVEHHLNHLPRRCLKGRVACEVFFHGASLHWDQRTRRAIFDSISRSYREKISRQPKDDTDPTFRSQAWRLAVEEWLRCHDLIRVTQSTNNKCQPIFAPQSAHN